MEGVDSLAGNDVLPALQTWSPLPAPLTAPFFFPPLLPFPLLRPPVPISWGWLCWMAAILGLHPWGEVPGVWGKIFVMLPTAFVRPSRNTILVPGRRYSGFLMKRKRQEALSPVRRCSLFMEMMEAVCFELPQCTAGHRGSMHLMYNNTKWELAC